MTEVWKDIEGYEGRYQISNLGRLKSFAQDKTNGKVKSGHIERKGYVSVVLYDGLGAKKCVKMHRLVAEAFIPNPNNLPQVNHKDEDKTNNSVDNLEWCTNEYNARYGTHFERVAQSNRCHPSTSAGVFAIDTNGNFHFYDSIGEAERKTGNSHCNIVRALKGRRPRCGGMYWFYSHEPQKRTSPTTTERRDTEQSVMQQSALAQ